MSLFDVEDECGGLSSNYEARFRHRQLHALTETAKNLGLHARRRCRNGPRAADNQLPLRTQPADAKAYARCGTRMPWLAANSIASS